jgi:hypothetical protein
MTGSMGEYNHHSSFGANLRINHKGTASATSQNSGAMAPTIACPMKLPMEQ